MRSRQLRRLRRRGRLKWCASLGTCRGRPQRADRQWPCATDADRARALGFRMPVPGTARDGGQRGLTSASSSGGTHRRSSPPSRVVNRLVRSTRRPRRVAPRRRPHVALGCQRRGAAAPTDAYWVRSNSSASADQGSSSQSSTSQSVSSSVHRSSALMAARALSSIAVSSVGSLKNARPVRVKMAPTPDAPKRRRAAASSRHSTTTAREPMCFSSHTRRVTPSRRNASNASAWCSSKPSRVVVAGGDMVGGR